MITKRYQALCAAVGFFCIVIGKISGKFDARTFHVDLGAFVVIIQTFSVLEWVQILVSVLLAGIFLDVFYADPADSDSYLDLLKLYHFNKTILRAAGKQRQYLEKQTYSLREYQEKVFHLIMKGASGTKYWSDKNFAEIKTIDDFISKQPLTDYAHYKPYVEKAMESASNTLFNDKIDYFAATTGTTSGKSKLYPLSKKIIQGLLYKGYLGCLWELNTLPRMNNMKRRIEVNVSFEILKTKNGVPQGPITAALKYNMPGNVTPAAGMEITDIASALYVQLLFAIRVNDACFILGLFSSHVLTFFRILEEKWDELCFDIQMGRVSKSIDLPEDTRTKLNKELKPDRKLAMRLRSEFHKGFKHIARRLWPELGVVMCISTGSFQVYTDVLKEKYLDSETIVFCYDHSATEGVYGLNITPLSKVTQFVICPYMTLYEFIPAEDYEKENPRTFLAHEVEVGQEYEIVISTVMGLYRYRTNDVIKIVGFYNQAPMYEFIRRLGDNLDLFGEKTTAEIIEGVTSDVFSRWSRMTLIDYSCTESVHLQNVTGLQIKPMHYVIFMEIQDDVSITEEISQQVDELLCKTQEEYCVDRTSGMIQPLRIVQVRSGTFERFKRLLVSSNPNASYTQIKIPRVTRRDEHIRLMIDSACITLKR